MVMEIVTIKRVNVIAEIIISVKIVIKNDLLAKMKAILVMDRENVKIMVDASVMLDSKAKIAKNKNSIVKNNNNPVVDLPKVLVIIMEFVPASMVISVCPVSIINLIVISQNYLAEDKKEAIAILIQGFVNVFLDSLAKNVAQKNSIVPLKLSLAVIMELVIMLVYVPVILDTQEIIVIPQNLIAQPALRINPVKMKERVIWLLDIVNAKKAFQEYNAKILLLIVLPKVTNVENLLVVNVMN